MSVQPDFVIELCKTCWTCIQTCGFDWFWVLQSIKHKDINEKASSDLFVCVQTKPFFYLKHAVMLNS